MRRLYQGQDHGRILVRIDEKMAELNVSKSTLCRYTDSKYDVINRYWHGATLRRADLDILARICYVLECPLHELMYYAEPEQEDEQPDEKDEQPEEAAAPSAQE